jgi:formyltetrahydrofolate synthetase
VAAAVSTGFAEGGKGTAELAEAVVDACDGSNGLKQLYDDDDSVKAKIEAVAPASTVRTKSVYYLEAERKIQQFTDQGLAHLPVCMAKTPLSLSADPDLIGAPTDFQLPVRDVRAYTGAGWAGAALRCHPADCRAWAGRRRRTTWTSTRRAGQLDCSRRSHG